MYFILSADGTKAFYLFESREYIIGRKECDILIKDDTSVSRKHAMIFVKKGKIEITDMGAKYGTFVNNIQLQASVPKELNLGDKINFGILSSTYFVKEQKLHVASSGLTLDEKKVLSDIMKKLEGNVLLIWSKECSFLTVREIMLTLKVLCALIEGQPLVTLDFWTDFMKNVNKNIPPPDPSNYKPVCAAVVLNKNINFKYDPARKSLFESKVFVFKTKASKMKIEAVIELAGGTSICWNEKQLAKEMFSSNNPQYLLVQDDQKSPIQNDSFMEMISYLHSIGKRSIPFQEVAMAIVLASCSKDCNPDFDRAGTLIKQEEQIVFTENILAPKTQTQDDEIEEKPSVVVPETAHEVLNVSEELIQHKTQDEGLTKQKQFTTTTAKRTGEQLSNEMKKIRLENEEEKEKSAQGKHIPSQNLTENDEEIDIKPLEEIDEILNEPDELNAYKNQANKEYNKAANKSNVSGKREGHQLHKDAKKMRLENARPAKENSPNICIDHSSKSTSEECIVTSTQNETVEKGNIIDLTEPNDKIITSTQIEHNFIQGTSKLDHQKQKSADYFGFIRPESKQTKNKTTTKISEFFKPFSKSNENTQENITNISAIDVESPSTSGKRKFSEEISSNLPAKKQNFVKNPFSLNKQSKTTESANNQSSFSRLSTRTINKSNTKKDNPFADVIRGANKVKQDPVENTNRETMPYTFNITIIDKQMEKNHSWLSKNTVIKDEIHGISKNTTEMDEKIQKFAESLHNCIVIETRPLVVDRVLIDKINEMSVTGKKNFKKFKKVQPLSIQTTIVPRASYVLVDM